MSLCLGGIRRIREHRKHYRARSQPGKPIWVMANRLSDVFPRLLRESTPTDPEPVPTLLAEKEALSNPEAGQHLVHVEASWSKKRFKRNIDMAR